MHQIPGHGKSAGMHRHVTTRWLHRCSSTNWTRLLADGSTLVIANGGIRTHPDLPRIKSNLANMRPSLAYVDVASGRLLQLQEPEPQWHQLSIRHIDVSPDDRVAVAMQFEGSPISSHR